MTTGGRGLTPERVKAAKEAGIRSVSVSVDGLGVHPRRPARREGLVEGRV
jgi:MoaA/NifB/PqqE/SkfB family radical SAM enzyme